MLSEQLSFIIIFAKSQSSACLASDIFPSALFPVQLDTAVIRAHKLGFSGHLPGTEIRKFSSALREVQDLLQVTSQLGNHITGTATNFSSFDACRATSSHHFYNAVEDEGMSENVYQLMRQSGRL